ncbi:MAG: serine protease [Shimia sp.]
MGRLVGAILVILVGLWGGMAAAQSEERVWIQVEAQPSLVSAQEAARRYAATLPDVAGFQLSGSWYGIALGPYDRPDAEARLAELRSRRAVPFDSFIAFEGSFRGQFYPIGANALNRPTIDVPQTAPDTTQAALPPAEPTFLDGGETLREARRSEGLLNREERRELQRQLEWAGFYRAGIDGAFGPGTRRAMQAWQSDRGYEPTGVMTTLQRVALRREYDAILEGTGLALVTDDEAGISMQLPTEMVVRAEVEPPFVQYDSTTADGVRVILVSQEGSRDRFRGLYAVMQTLDILPPTGPRELGRDSFTIEGRDDDVHSLARVAYRGGEMKGYVVVWPAGDEERRRRVLGEMEASFATLPGTLDPALARVDESQSIDLVAGLAVRKPVRAGSGFFVDGRGTVLTAAANVTGCGRVSLGGETDAQVLFADEALGLAALRPDRATVPLASATFQSAVPRLGEAVSVAGYSFGGVLGAPTLTYGTLADLRGLRGEEDVKRVALAAQPGDAGGPVFDAGGAVLGVLLPRGGGDTALPPEVAFASDTDTIRDRLSAAGLSIDEATARGDMSAVELTALARDMTVLVECWEG